MSTEPVLAVTVPMRRLDPATVPQICLKTGLTAQCVIPTVATTAPSWAWALVIPGGAPYFAARRWLFPREIVHLPARNAVFDKWQMVRRGIVGCFAVAIVIALWAIATVTPTGLFAATFVGAATTGGWMLLTPTYWIAAELAGTDVKLSGVHPGAARALLTA